MPSSPSQGYSATPSRALPSSSRRYSSRPRRSSTSCPNVTHHSPQPLIHRTQERWSTTNPGSASLEPGFVQGPVQDANAQVHYQMHPAPGLVCSDQPEGRLHSCFDPSVTQTIPTVCVRGSAMVVQGPPPPALSVSPCLYEVRRGRFYPATGSRHQGPQLPRRLAYLGPIQRAVVRSQGLGASAPQPVGLRVNWEKSKLSPMQIISFLGVALDSVSMTACLTDEHAQAVLNCLSSFRGRNVVSLKQFQRFLGHMASAAAVTPLGLLHMRPLQHWLHSRVPRWAWRRGTLRVNITQHCHHSLSPWTDHAFLRAGVPLEQVSRHTVVTPDASSTDLGRYMQRAGSLGALDRAPTALAHQLPRAVGSASSPTAVLATAVGQARASPHGQYCVCLVYQPVGGYTITPHVTARPPSPPLESHAFQVTAHCPHLGEAQSCGRCALTTAHIPWRVATPSRDDSADLESIRGSSGGPVCFP